MEDNKQKRIISKETLIPIGFVILICSGFFYAGNLSASVNNNEEAIDAIVTKVEAVPTRMEYEEMRRNIVDIGKSLEVIEEDIKLLISQ